MHFRLSFWMVVLSLTGSALFAAAPAVLRAGRWEITIRTESRPELQPMVTEVCISKAEAESIAPPVSKENDDCKVASGGVAGRVMNYIVKCASRDFSSHARFTFNDDAYEGVVDIKSRGVDVRQTYSARRIGDCEPTPAAP